MKKLLPHELLRNRKKSASAILQKLAHDKIKSTKTKQSILFQEIAYKLQVSDQTIFNYAIHGHDKDGYLIDAITQEFKKL